MELEGFNYNDSVVESYAKIVTEDMNASFRDSILIEGSFVNNDYNEV